MSYTPEQLKQDKQGLEQQRLELEKQLLMVKGALLYVSQILDKLQKEEAVK